MVRVEDDYSTQLQAEAPDDGGGGTLAGTLTNEVPGTPIYIPLTPVYQEADAPAPVPAAASAGTAAPAAGTTVSLSPNSVGALGNAWNKALNAVGTTSNSLNASGQKAAKSLGVSDDTAAKIGPWVPWLLVAVLVGIGSTVYALRHRIFHHKITA